MEPYFYTIQEEIVSKSFKEFLTNHSFNRLDDFVPNFVKKQQVYDGNNILKIENLSEIWSLKNQCCLNFKSLVLMHRPNSKILKHIDGPHKRNCVIIVPLYPHTAYAPTKFYKTKDKNLDNFSDSNHQLAAVCNFDDMKSVFFNTQEMHSLSNNNNFRFNLQLCFNETFTEVIELYKRKKLFKFQV